MPDVSICQKKTFCEKLYHNDDDKNIYKKAIDITMEMIINAGGQVVWDA